MAKKKRVRRRSNGELARDRRVIADLYLKGNTQAEIADVLGCHQTTVSRDLKALQREWQTSSLIDFDEAKAQELAKIDHLEREAWLAYLRSQEDAETFVRKEKRPGTQVVKGAQELTSTTTGQVGDPRFLAIVDKCIARRCKIIGLDAPDRTEVSGPGGSPLAVTTSSDVIRVIVHKGDDND